MSATADPPPLPASASAGRFSLRNWWRNGWACRISVLFAVLALLNLFEPWEPDYHGAGYRTTQWEGNELVRREYSGTSAEGGGNAFTAGKGWIPLVGLAGALFVCGRPRRSLGGLRWLPLCAGIIIFACVFDEVRRQEKETEAWLSKFGTRPVVVRPAAMQWVIIFSFGMIVSGAFFARRVGGGTQPPVRHPAS